MVGESILCDLYFTTIKKKLKLKHEGSQAAPKGETSGPGEARLPVR